MVHDEDATNSASLCTSTVMEELRDKIAHVECALNCSDQLLCTQRPVCQQLSKEFITLGYTVGTHLFKVLNKGLYRPVLHPSPVS